MRLTLGSRSYDLRTRALVMGVPGPSAEPVARGADIMELVGQGADIMEMVGQGADIVQLTDPGRPMPVPVCVTAGDEEMVRRSLSAGVDLLHLPEPTPSSLAMCAEAGAAVLVPPGASAEATAAGLPPDRVVLDSLLLDVTAEEDPVVATVVGVIRGARIVRTADVPGARRVCDVLAAVLEAP